MAWLLQVTTHETFFKPLVQQGHCLGAHRWHQLQLSRVKQTVHDLAR